MKVSELIESAKKSTLESKMNKKYVPFLTKVDECGRVIKLSSYKEVDDKKIYWKNTANQYFLFVLALIRNYFDIQFDENIVENFDQLNESGVIEKVIKVIGDKEYQEWQTILSMTENDEYENNASMRAVIENKLDALSLMINSASEAIDNLQTK